MESCWTVDNSQEISSTRDSVGRRFSNPPVHCFCVSPSCDLERTTLLACTKLFAALVFRVVGLFSVLRETLNKLTTRNTRDANHFVHAEKLSRKKRSASRVGASKKMETRNSCFVNPCSQLSVSREFGLSAICASPIFRQSSDCFTVFVFWFGSIPQG